MAGVRGVRHAVEPVSQVPEDHDEAEVVEGLPVPAESGGTVTAAEPVLVPARQAAALAATSFVAGAATVAVVHRRRGRLPRRKRKNKGALGEIVASNSFLVDVHLLRRD